MGDHKYGGDRMIAGGKCVQKKEKSEVGVYEKTE